MNDIMEQFILDEPCEPNYFLHANPEQTNLFEAIKIMESFEAPLELYLEALDDPAVQGKKGMQGALRNTRKLYHRTTKVGGSVVNAQAGVYHNAANLILTIMGNVAKIFTWMMKRLSSLIKFVERLSKKIGAIPSTIRAKIKGDIQLYVTVGDIQTIYNSSVITKLDSFIGTLGLFVQGETWDAAFKMKLPVVVNNVLHGGKSVDNDMKLAKRLRQMRLDFENIGFSPTTVKMDDQRNVDIYFGNEPVVQFVDLEGKQHNDTYYQAIQSLLRDIHRKKESIQKLQEIFGTKMQKSELNNNWASLNARQQDIIRDAFEDINVVVRVVGSLCKSIVTDVNTIEKAYDKLSK